MVVSIIANLYLNIFVMDWWAQGNFFLLFNTFFMFTQSAMAIPEIFEIPVVLTNTKPLRVAALNLGIIYNVIYVLAFAD
jgi:hypothetical protein